MAIVYLNGDFLPQEQARVSVLDRGFLFGDGIYEVIPVYHGRIFRLNEHLRRLKHSLSAIGIRPPLDDTALSEIFQQLLEQNPAQGSDQVIYLQITRGADTKRHHNVPSHLPPTLFVQITPLASHDLNLVAQGWSAIVVEDTRWAHCHIKATSLLANVLLNQAAKDAQCEEAILMRQDYLSEGASSNVFIVKDSVLMTPPLSDHILGGITRDLVLELAQHHTIDHRETAISREALFAADEVWITSSTRKIFPITQLNDKPVGTGNSGPLWQSMINHYQRFIQNL